MAKNSDVLLVGSVPLASVDEVFHLCGTLIGDRVACLPDGEIGDRAYWILYLAYRTYHGHPDIRTVQKPATGWLPTTGVGDVWSFKLKRGVKKLKFKKLGYADAALSSYAAFCRAREAGHIPRGVRFQVALPFPQDATFLFFRDTDDHAAVMAAYEQTLGRELAQMFKKIPLKDLCIQWDVCTDLLEFTGRYYSWSRSETAWERYLAPLQRLPRSVPAEVMLGFHFCYGTWPQKPALMPEDLTLSVRFANAAVAASGRRVDFVHLTVPKIRTDDIYFRPLGDLAVGDTRVYLGVINNDGLEGTRERIKVARKYLKDFGVAAECGFGREPPDKVPGILKLHRKIADELLK
ncbi:MAG: hypothetical protein ACREXT_14590 [Gammaproteobacteria bacterium]